MSAKKINSNTDSTSSNYESYDKEGIHKIHAIGRINKIKWEREADKKTPYMKILKIDNGDVTFEVVKPDENAPQSEKDRYETYIQDNKPETFTKSKKIFNQSGNAKNRGNQRRKIV